MGHRSQYRRWVDNIQPLNDGWWRLTLSCGHACSVLHGKTEPMIRQIACLPCQQDAERVSPPTGDEQKEIAS